MSEEEARRATVKRIDLMDSIILMYWELARKKLTWREIIMSYVFLMRNLVTPPLFSVYFLRRGSLVITGFWYTFYAAVRV